MKIAVRPNIEWSQYLVLPHEEALQLIALVQKAVRYSRYNDVGSRITHAETEIELQVFTDKHFDEIITEDVLQVDNDSK